MVSATPCLWRKCRPQLPLTSSGIRKASNRTPGAPHRPIIFIVLAYAVSVSNIVQHRVLSGTFNELSRHLVSALRKRGLWSEQIRVDILAAHGESCLLNLHRLEAHHRWQVLFRISMASLTI